MSKVEPIANNEAPQKEKPGENQKGKPGKNKKIATVVLKE